MLLRGIWYTHGLLDFSEKLCYNTGVVRTGTVGSDHCYQELLRKELPEMKQFTMIYLYSEHYEESFYHESEEALFVLHTDKRSG